MKIKFSNDEILREIHSLWNTWFGILDENFKKNCEKLYGFSYDSMYQSFETYSNLSYFDLIEIQKLLLKKTIYPTNSNLNLFFGASTIPITPFPEILYSLLLRTPIICRIPENYSMEFYQYFQNRIPESLKQYIQFVHWSSQDKEQTCKLIEEADCVIVHGSDNTIEEINNIALENSNKNIKKKLVLGFGHKTSFMACRPIIENIPLLIKDILAFKQLGCLSPQVIYLLVDSFSLEDVREFIYYLASNIHNTDFHLTPEESYLKRAFLEDIATSSNCKIIAESIIQTYYEDNIECNVGYGTVLLKEVVSLESISPNIKSPRVGSIGHDFNEYEEKTLKDLFPNTRICKIGEMQNPSLYWIQEPIFRSII